MVSAQKAAEKAEKAAKRNAKKAAKLAAAVSAVKSRFVCNYPRRSSPKRSLCVILMCDCQHDQIKIISSSWCCVVKGGKNK